MQHGDIHRDGADPASRLSRRRLLRGMGIGFVGLSAASLLAACGGSSAGTTPATSASTTTTTTTSTSGGTSASTATTGTSGAASPSAAGSPSAGTFTVPTISAGSHTLKLLMWSHFVPAYDTWFDKWAKETWGPQNKVTVTVDHIPTNTIPTRVSAEIAANSGHDLVLYQTGTDLHVFADKMMDLSDLANYLGGKYGGWLSFAVNVGTVGGKWRGIPEFYISFPGLYRKDLFDANGLQPVAKWEDLVTVGQKLKPKGNPVGIALSHTGDSNSSLYSVLWSYGGAVTGKDGKTVTIKSDGTKAAIDYVVNLYKNAMTPEVLSWDDASNNRLLDSGVACWIQNPISAYRSADAALQQKIYVSQSPVGPAGQFCNSPIYSWGIMDWSKEQAAAEKFLVDYFADWTEAFTASTGYNHPMLKAHEAKPMPVLGSDPKLEVLQDFGKYVQTIGYPGPATAAAGQVNNTYVIPDMFAKACTGMSSDDAMSWADQQIKAIYDKFPTT